MRVLGNVGIRSLFAVMAALLLFPGVARAGGVCLDFETEAIVEAGYFDASYYNGVTFRTSQFEDHVNIDAVGEGSSDYLDDHYANVAGILNRTTFIELEFDTPDTELSFAFGTAAGIDGVIVKGYDSNDSEVGVETVETKSGTGTTPAGYPASSGMVDISFVSPVKTVRIEPDTDLTVALALDNLEFGDCESAFLVDIDIKPGSDPNSINRHSLGNVPVAILGSEMFDATTVDPGTLQLGSALVAIQADGTLMASLEDANGDGYVDLVVHFFTSDLGFASDATEATLTGATFDVTGIEGSDSIRIVK